MKLLIETSIASDFIENNEAREGGGNCHGEP